MNGSSHIGCNMNGVWDKFPTCYFSNTLIPLNQQDEPIAKSFDENGDGKLSTSEIQTALGAHGIKGTVTFLSSFFHSADKDDDGHLDESELMDGIRDVSSSSSNGGSSMFMKVAFVLGTVFAGAYYGTKSPDPSKKPRGVKCSVFRDALAAASTIDDESTTTATTTCTVVPVTAQSITGTSCSSYITPQQPIRKYDSLRTSGSSYVTPSAPPMPAVFDGADPNMSF
jgi:hypothetical protein